MKKQILSGALFALLGALASTSALATIVNTKHNLGATSPAVQDRNNSFANTTQVCVFCHTPHGANVTNNEAPLWNKTLPDDTAFAPYAPIGTTEGEVIQSLSGTSLACLSCHDGSQAIDNMINAPGSGGYVAGGESKGWAAIADGGTVTVDGTNKFGATAAANIGGGTTDLSNDHPIGIMYCGGGQTTATNSACVDTGFNAPAEYTVGLDKRYYVETGGNATKDKTDIWLYNRTFAAAAVTGPSVECASCHDVHSENNLFMRYASDPLDGNKGSELCLACHIK